MLVPDGAVIRNAATMVTTPATLTRKGNNLFLDAMLEMPTTAVHDSRRPLKMAASVLIHAGIIALLIIVPIYFAANTVDIQKLATTYVFTPPPPVAPSPPAAAAAPPQRAVQTMPRLIQPTAIVAPRVIPKQTAATATNVQAPPLNEDAGVPGGVPGGVLGGILGGTGTFAGPPPPTNSQGIVRVGGNVRPPELVQRVPPEYPAVARAAHVQGTVVIDAVIDKTGNVVSEHAVSGPGLLIPAALNAVQQWKYQPTYLNGQPVELAMEVTVAFNLG
jgi:protein TonB